MQPRLFRPVRLLDKWEYAPNIQLLAYFAEKIEGLSKLS